MNNEYEIRGRDVAIFIETTKGEKLETLISVMDLEKVRNFIGYWYPVWSEGTKSYYALGYGGLVNEPKRVTSLHRWIMDEPKNFVVDHVNGETLMNQYSNLRVVSHSINVLNQKNTGVVKYKDRWKAQFTYEGEPYNLGYYATEEEARKVLEEVKGDFIVKEALEHDYENDLQEVRDGLEIDEGFHVVYCESCKTQDTLELYGTFDTRGNNLHSYYECNNCGAEHADIKGMGSVI